MSHTLKFVCLTNVCFLSLSLLYFSVRSRPVNVLFIVSSFFIGVPFEEVVDQKILLK